MQIRLTAYSVLLSLISAAASAQRLPTGAQLVANNDVTWHSLGASENDSMPLGNGSLGANVWTEANGDLVLLVSSPDAWTEMGKLVKLGRVRLRLTPNPFVGSGDFTEVLHLENGAIEIHAGSNTARIWLMRIIRRFTSRHIRRSRQYCRCPWRLGARTSRCVNPRRRKPG